MRPSRRGWGSAWKRFRCWIARVSVCVLTLATSSSPPRGRTARGVFSGSTSDRLRGGCSAVDRLQVNGPRVCRRRADLTHTPASMPGHQVEKPNPDVSGRAPLLPLRLRVYLASRQREERAEGVVLGHQTIEPVGPAAASPYPIGPASRYESTGAGSRSIIGLSQVCRHFVVDLARDLENPLRVRPTTGRLGQRIHQVEPDVLARDTRL